MGDHFIELVVTDSAGLFDTQNFILTVYSSNRHPSFISPAVVEANENLPYTYNIFATDPDDGDTLSISAELLPEWLTLTDHGDGTAYLL